jgi:hypothetical protein
MGGAMSEATADIVGTTGANFTIRISAGTILSAYLEVTNQPIVALAIGGNDREVAVPSLPAGDSLVRLDLVWATGESNAEIDVGTVTAGSVAAPPPKQTIDDGETPGYVELFGK